MNAEVQPSALVRLHGKVMRTYDSRPQQVKIVNVYTFNARKERRLLIPRTMFCPVSEGDAITAYGLVENNPQYGQQLRATAPPWVEIGVDKETVIQCFCRALRGTGIGNIKAQKLYATFNKYAESLSEKETVSYISDLSHRLVHNEDTSFFCLYSDVVNERQMMKLLKWWYKSRSLRRLYLLGLTKTDIRAVKYMSHDEIYEKCVENPYQVVELSLEKCDAIMNRLNKSIDPMVRYHGTILRKINDYNTRGWTGVPSFRLKKDFPDMTNHMKTLRENYDVHGELYTIYLDRPYCVETYMATELAHMINANFHNEPGPDPNFIRKTLTPEQKDAVKMSLDNQLSIITGGPGTGKTTIVSEIVHNLELRNISYAVASFTGKAVARIREVIGKGNASTLHKMIAKSGKFRGFQHLIIDETSMVTAELLYTFMKVFNDEPYKITLVGDANQLMPISWGNLFGELLKTNMVPFVKLKKNHRVIEGIDINGIIINSRRIINYDPDDEDDRIEGLKFKTTLNFQLIEGNIDIVYDIVRALKNQGSGPNDVTILSPYNRSLDELNATCQQIFNDGEEYVTDSRDKTWMIGDRVMMIVNNYEVNIMNGEEGMVEDVSLDKGTILVDFPGHGKYEFKLEPKPNSIHEYDDVDAVGFSDGEKHTNTDELTVLNLRHSYSVTVHKSQGSEWEYVVLYVPLGKTGGSFLNRNLIYTAITRAKRCVYCVGNVQAIINGAATKPGYRCDNLAIRIQEEVPRIEAAQKEQEGVAIEMEDPVEQAPVVSINRSDDLFIDRPPNTIPNDIGDTIPDMLSLTPNDL